MKMFLSLMLIMLSLIMLFLNHPISMGLIILMQAFVICALTGMLIKTYWFSYILFLIFLGGLLVLFIYVSSIASNEMFKINFTMKMTIYSIMMILIIITLLNWDNLYWMNSYLNNEMMMFFNNIMMNNEHMQNLSKFYNKNTNLIMIMMIIYLFITLVMVIKITNIFFGPLRSNF